MIDIHCHILPGLDDGAQTIEESLKMVRIAQSEGIQKIIATPHHIEGSYHNAKEKIIRQVEILNEAIKEEEIPLEIFSGQEIFLTMDTAQHLKEERLLTLADSKYVLIEFPLMEIPRFAEHALYSIQLNGLIPVIAHPERIASVIEDPCILEPLINKGCLLQVNAMSLTGHFGRKVQATAEYLVKSNMVHLMGTDAHNDQSRTPKMTRALEKTTKLMGQEYTDNLMLRAGKIIEDEHIEWLASDCEELRRKSFFKKFKFLKR